MFISLYSFIFHFRCLECKTGLHDYPLDRYCREGRAAYRCECDGTDCHGWCFVDGELKRDNNIEIKNCDVCSCKVCKTYYI